MNLTYEYNVVPGVMPVDTAATAISTQYVDIKTANSVEFLAAFGVVTSASADQPVTITVMAATAQAGTGAAAVAFTYRLSSAVAANSWGDPTAATATGYAPVATTIGGKMLHIYLDPAAIAAAKADARWVCLTITPDAGVTACNVCAIPLYSPRYPGASMVSAT